MTPTPSTFGATLAGMNLRTALVAGAASGIGASVARGLANTGHMLVLLDRDAIALDRIALELADSLAVEPLRVDAAARAKVEAALGALPAHARPDILVTSVGGDVRRVGVTDLTADDLTRAVDDNLVAAFTLLRLCAPAMVERRWGRIVNVASVAGRSYSHFSNAAYVAAKAGVIGLTKQSAYELAPYGVCVNAVAPGPIDTPRVREAWDAKSHAEREQILDRIPAGRLGTADEAAATILHLCSETAGYTIGAVIDLNGGLHI